MNMILHILLLFIAVRKSLSVDENFTICSVPRSCGRQSIKFPFFFQDEDQHDFSRCGYPGFNISCRNNTDPILSLRDGDYIIHDISYQTQSFHVSAAVPFGRGAVCSHSITNISIPEDRFFLPRNQKKLFLLFNCNLTPGLSQYKLNCSVGDESNATLALFDDDPNLLNYASENCEETVVTPVSFHEEEINRVEEMVNRGFVLNWIASNCSICEAAGGHCGFDYSTYHFKCFCSDRPHAWHCGPGKSNRFRIIIDTAASCIGGIVVSIILLGFYFKRKLFSFSICMIKSSSEEKKIEAFLKGYESLAPKRYRYFEIKNITNSFQNKLGKGGYGDVYKGKLLDGRQVAVKVLNKSGSNGQEFINEVASISRTSHVNVVTLLGFCFEADRRVLIYEFVANGSLEKFIFRDKVDQSQLGWETLYKIAIGIARGLEYLHQGCNTRILHFDIKPRNILLGDDFCPKISDFGHAKLCPDIKSAISMTGARGTIGYIAPEVFSRNFGRVSHKSDVYSYGMMILEMAGGRRNINVEADHTSEIYFPHWIYSHMELDEELGLQGIVDEDD